MEGVIEVGGRESGRAREKGGRNRVLTSMNSKALSSRCLLGFLAPPTGTACRTGHMTSDDIT